LLTIPLNLKEVLFPVFLLPVIYTISFAQPAITSFSPMQGPAGTVVSIVGTNFNPQPELNHVFFGPVRGKITYASLTSLQVIVPVAADSALLK
jgi:hypothetical protein